jgi:SAM-dependent methyltransferase
MLTTKQKEALGPLFVIANKVRLNLLRIKYRGNKVHCVCCGSNFKEFARFGGNKRRNAWCPKCESLERHRLLWMYLEKQTDIYSKPLKVLHIAPELSFFYKFKKYANIDYHPADIFPNLFPKGTIYFDLLHNDAPDNTYDAIICNHVFQYIADDKKAMQEVYRIMKPGGWGILQVPLDKTKEVTYEDATITDPIEREKAFGLKEHVRFYGMDYGTKLKAAGFDVFIDDYTSAFSDDEIFKYGFWKGDPIYRVYKH